IRDDYAFTAITTPALDAKRNICSLVSSTKTGFTIAAGTGGSLGIYSGNITRQDVSGTEATQTISANITLGDPSGGTYTGTWSIDGSNSLQVSGNIGEAGGSRGITKTGASSLILSGSNTFSGGLTITAGTVFISSDANLGASSGGLTLNGGTLDVQGSFTSTRPLTISAASTL